MPARSSDHSRCRRPRATTRRDAIERMLKPAADAGLLPPFPFGTDFTAVEQRLIPALEVLKSASPSQIAILFLRGLMSRSNRKDCA